MSERRGHAAPAAGSALTFWLFVGVTTVFSQFWVTALTGVDIRPVPEQLSAMARLGFLPAYLAVVVLALTRPGPTLLAFRQAPLVSLLLVLCLASMLWTVDAEQTWRRFIAVFLTSLAGVMLAERFTWPALLEVLAATFLFVVAMSFVYGLFIPSLGRMTVDFPGAWQGVYSHKNVLGHAASVGMTVFAAAALANRERRGLWILGLVAAGALLALSGSKTSLVAGLMGLSCIPLIALGRKGPAQAVAATYLLGGGAALLAGLMLFSPDLLLGLLGKDETLTGRTRIWSAILDQIAKRPLLGYGYGAVWDNPSPWGPAAILHRQLQFFVDEAHDTWLGVWLDTGLVGVIAWSLLLAAVWMRVILRLYVEPAAYFAAPFLIVMTLHSLTEEDALLQNDLIWLIFVAVAVKLALRRRPEARVARPEEPAPPKDAGFSAARPTFRAGGLQDAAA